ncbi:MAG: hypothetical protein ABJC12_12990 [Saprospiraceae bacterium]
MKKNHIFNIMICFFFLMLAYSCDNADLQKSLPKDTAKVTTRTNDCEDCPVGDCCCYIIYTSGSGAPLQLCGTTGTRLSSQECEVLDPPNGCPAITGYYFGPFTIDNLNTSQIFCLPQNSAFMINVPSGNVSVTITCQYGQISPQTVTPTLVGGHRYFFHSNSNCELAGC